MKLRLCLISYCVAAATGVFAQTATPTAQPVPATAAGIPAEAKQAYIRVRDNILKAVAKMPEENYAYKPTPDIRTFAEVVNHVTEAQTRICSGLNGQTKAAPPAAKTKTEVVAAVKESFAECDQAYDSVNDANMAQMVGTGAVHRSKLAMLFGNVSHDNEMYATMSLYMRLKGILPPSSEARPAPPK